MTFELCLNVDENLRGLESLERYKASALEVQLTSSKPPIADLMYLPYRKLIIHMGKPIYELDAIVNDRGKIAQVESILSKLSRFRSKISVIFHAGWGSKTACDDRIIEFVRHMLFLYDVDILLENTVGIAAYDRATHICKIVDNQRAGVCLNLACVRRVKSSNIDLEKYFSELNNVKHIHLSYYNKDFIMKDLIDFGTKHKDEGSLMRDIEILNSFNISNCTVSVTVPEIRQTDRINQISEIQLMQKVGLIR